MAKPIVVGLNGEASSFQLSKLERQKLYGARRRIPVDERGEPCTRAALTDDGAVLLVSGMTAQGWFRPDGAQVETGAIGARAPDGSPLVLIASTLGEEQPLEGPVSPSEVLDLAVSSIYRLEAESIGDGLASSLAAGDIWRFRFNYRPDYRAETAYLLGNSEGFFALIGVPAPAIHLAPNAAPPPEEDEEDAGELDFEML